MHIHRVQRLGQRLSPNVGPFLREKNALGKKFLLAKLDRWSFYKRCVAAGRPNIVLLSNADTDNEAITTMIISVASQVAKNMDMVCSFAHLSVFFLFIHFPPIILCY